MDKSKLVSRIKFCVFLIGIGIAIFVIIENRHHISPRTISHITEFIRSKGIYAVIIFLLLFALKPILVVIPTNIVEIMGSVLFGPIYGIILSTIGLWLSATVAFYLAKFLGKDFVKSILGNKTVKIDDKIEKDGFRVLLMLRLPPIIPYDALSYACGFTEIKYSHFILASVLGVMPETLCYCILGENFKTPLSWQFIVPISILLIGTIFAKPIMNLINNKKLNHARDENN